MKGQVQTNWLIAFACLATFVVAIVFPPLSCGNLFSGEPPSKSVEEYLRIVAQKSYKFRRMGKEDQDHFIHNQMKVAEMVDRISEEQLKEEVEKGWMVHLEKRDIYIPRGEYKSLMKKVKDLDLKLENLGFSEVKNTKGVTFQDSDVFGEKCYALEPVARSYERANRAYNKRTRGGQLKPAACWRSEARQLAGKTLRVIGCTGADYLNEEKVRKCVTKTNGTMARPKSSGHRLGVKIDEIKWAKARKELAAEGFVVGCKSKIGRGDKRDASWLAKEGSVWNLALCKIGI
jgi:hypothetical protein